LLIVSATLDVKALIERGAAVILASYAHRPFQVSAITALVYAASIIAFIPTTLPELALGFVFGLRIGYLIDLAGKVFGCSLCYLLGLTVLKECIRRLLWQGDAKEIFLAFEEEVQLRPWRTAALLRVAFMPMSIKDYGMAIIGVPPLAYWGTLLPVVMFDSYVPVAVGSTANDLASLLSGSTAKHFEHINGTENISSAASNEKDANDEAEHKAMFQLAMVCAQVAVLLVLICYLGSVAKKTIAKRRQQKAEAEPLEAKEAEAEPQVAEPLGGKDEGKEAKAEPLEAKPLGGNDPGKAALAKGGIEHRRSASV